jgi:hypothetical protein
MRDSFNRLRKFGQQTFADQRERALGRTCAGRIVSALTFLVVILCLALWITAFILLRDQVFARTLTGTILTDLSCVAFFGGLGIAVLIGALVGNFLRRSFWKILIKRESEKMAGKDVHQ